jgi:hypothetical protein
VAGRGAAAYFRLILLRFKSKLAACCGDICELVIAHLLGFDLRRRHLDVPRHQAGDDANEFYRVRHRDRPQYGQVATLEAAKQAFRAASDRRPKASEKS